MNADLSFRSGLKDVVPTLFGYIGVGLAMGIVANTSHLSVLAVLLMSLIVYAGSAQFIIISMLLAGSPVSAIVLSTFLINSRMILMSMSIAQYFKKDSLWQNIGLGSLLTDETFALSMNKINLTDKKLRPQWLHAANIIAYLVWAAATVVGCLLGNLITDPNQFGLDFAVVGMFIGLLYLQIITDRSKSLKTQLLVVLFVAIAMYFLMRFVPGNIALLIATLLGCGFGMVVSPK
ncbi:AzlC family ABC transporter permease [Lactiplantibacillus fabifermentans]|uniref:Amino acid transport protein n=2 Tax=Lactiplantibacillus fabifermentans TaxID=483011 RepID=A0A0R2NNB1_9LACO|nr:AzlC family ABC transporter permease [Lactiplantibacillus fabifermentans]ETY74957.1 azaleucine resistance protein AzlC [Lactiplantibacillus fabifermentans T30PCM01]KRO27166.1 amino acid transport protein [Lactiplantibacillus fabifermentans DSM 21115]